MPRIASARSTVRVCVGEMTSTKLVERALEVAALEPEGLAEREAAPRVLEADLVDLVEVRLDPEVDHGR